MTYVAYSFCLCWTGFANATHLPAYKNIICNYSQNVSFKSKQREKFKVHCFPLYHTMIHRFSCLQKLCALICHRQTLHDRGLFGSITSHVVSHRTCKQWQLYFVIMRFDVSMYLWGCYCKILLASLEHLSALWIKMQVYFADLEPACRLYFDMVSGIICAGDGITKFHRAP